MAERSQITMDSGLRRRAQQRATELGISFSEYVRRIVAGDLGGTHAKADVSIVFDLTEDGPPTAIAREKDRLIADAMWQQREHKKSRPATPRRTRRR